MFRTFQAAAAVAALLICSSALAGPGPQVEFVTSQGSFVVEVYPDKAPKTVANFLQYVREGFYRGTVFHRVIPGFVIQGGGFDADLHHREPRAPIENEAANGLRNERGTLSMARTREPHSASSQFFVNLVDNAVLDHRAPTPSGYGYAVFARVIKGMDVVDRIAAVPTGFVAGMADVPTTPVIIDRACIVGAKNC